MKESRPLKSGFVTIVGKPNVGKSTLINAIVGNKVSITSPKPQTTRHRVMGVKNGDNFQIVFVDTPGVHKPEHELGKFMEKTYRSELRSADLAIFMVEGTHEPKDEDYRARNIVMKSDKFSIPVILVINKKDIVGKEKFEEIKKKYIEMGMGNFTAVIETSALKGEGLDTLVETIAALLPEGPPYFPEDMVTDQTPEQTAAEIVREKLLYKTRQEIPHSVFVYTEEMREGSRPDELFFRVLIYVERESQKGIIIGKNGAKLKEIGTMARIELEKILEKKVFLELWVKVKEDWKDRTDLLKAWGYEI